MKVVNEDLLDRFRAPVPCAWCRIRVATDPHHIFSRGAGRLDVAINLVSLCRLDHCNAHDGHQPTREQLLQIVSRREKLPVETILDRIYLLRRLPKNAEMPSWAT